jgi:hypothetical protein
MRISTIIILFLLLSVIVVDNNRASFAVDTEITTPQSIARKAARQKQLAQDMDKLERQKQLPAIVSVFRKWTSQERAHRLAYLCYEATLDTPFKPIDLAEIALAETGGHGLSGKAVSPRGAVGVWQLMPVRAKSHGYEPAEMNRDDKCAAAAVKELKTKLEMADGDLAVAKRLYCGAGKQARAYDIKIRQYRREILGRMAKIEAASQGS